MKIKRRASARVSTRLKMWWFARGIDVLAIALTVVVLSAALYLMGLIVLLLLHQENIFLQAIALALLVFLFSIGQFLMKRG